ncbi:MAG: DNA recombination protein RmuC, partial [Planctomycetota bacterium]|nr:DNA recombination protein RmuC [Planctomycetota bacterium]
MSLPFPDGTAPLVAAAVSFILFLTAAIAAVALSRRLKRIGDVESGLRSELEAARLEAAALRTRLEERETALADLEKRYGLLERNFILASEAKAVLAAEKTIREQAIREQRQLWDKAEASLREAFGSLSREALGRNSEMFLTLAKAQMEEFAKGTEIQFEARRTAVDALVKPIGDGLCRMREFVEAAEKARSADHAGLVATHKALDETARKLVQALHHSSARGRWGELQLRRVVEMAGMLEHCDFEEQMTVADQDGKRLRPDLIVNLVGGRTIVVDAKAPMDSYLAAQEARDETSEKELRANHAKAVRRHMATLGEKSYWSQFENTPEFVVMFFPNEAVFADAIRIDPGLLDESVFHRVIPASPATLIALLKAAALGWQQERAARNARTIFTLARSLYKRFATAYSHLDGVGNSLAKAVENYNKWLASSERMLFPALKHFGELSENELFPEPEEVTALPRPLSPALAPPEDDSS